MWRVPVRSAARDDGAAPLWSAVDGARGDGAVGDKVDCWLSQPAMKDVAMNAVATRRRRRIMGTSPGWEGKVLPTLCGSAHPTPSKRTRRSSHPGTTVRADPGE